MYAQIIPTRRTPLTLPFFDYAVPDELAALIKPGQLVIMPFRSKDEFGVVRSVSESTSASTKNIKALKSIVHPQPFLGAAELSFLDEMAVLYHTSPGFLAQMILPPLQKRKLKGIKNEELRIKNPSDVRFVKPSLFVYKNDGEKKEYLQKCVTSDGQTLILVPEITDVEHLTNLLATSYKLPAITSNLGNKEIFDAWFKIWSGEVKLIIGTRRALFLSFNNLTNIVIDDEAHPSYKSWDMAPRFHTRDAALLLAQRHGAALHLLAHTPSVETHYFANKGIYTSVGTSTAPALSSRPSVTASGEISSSTLDSTQTSLEMTVNESKVTLIDIAGERKGGNYGLFSNELKNAIQSNTETIFLYCHRKGSMGYVMCRDCGRVSLCPNCKRSLNFHQRISKLVCHYCKYEEPMRPTCSSCNGVNIGMFGAGSEAVEAEVKKLFPHRKVLRIDSETIGTSSPFNAQNCIVVGTELAWQYIDWKKTKLMCLVDADTPLFIPEYKMAEEALHSILSARYNLNAKIPLLIQTKHPEHAVYQSLGNTAQFYTLELAHRKMFGYPPHKYLLRLLFGHMDKAAAAGEANRLYQVLTRLTKQSQDITITPPLATSPAYHAGKNWQVLVLKLSYSNYKKSIKAILKEVPGNWKVDPNPNTLLSF